MTDVTTTRSPDQSASTKQPRPEPERLIEIGLVLVDQPERTVRDARERALTSLRSSFPEFEWRMPVMERLVTAPRDRVEPTLLLDEGMHERDSRRWDFAVVVTQVDLMSYYRPFAIAVPSRAIGVAVLSTARLHGPLVDEEGAPRSGRATLAARIAALLIHLVGDLNGVPHCGHEGHFTSAPKTPSCLDAMTQTCPARKEHLTRELQDVADLRLEEVPDSARSGAVAFYARAIRINFDDIVSAVTRARPWEFPVRLGRVTAAATSSLFVLLLTAEVWELGTRESPVLVAAMSSAALLASTVFVLTQHRLLLLLGRGSRTEQIVTTNTAITLVVLVGMLATYLVVWLSALVIATLLFDAELEQRWAALDHSVPIVLFASFVASIGILVGALGSTFEGRYLRHVTFADEEV